MINLIDQINAQIERKNFSSMLEILSHLSLLSANVKVKIIESGLAAKIVMLLEHASGAENLENEAQKELNNKHLVSFVVSLKNVSEIDFYQKPLRFKLLFWEVVSRMFFLVDGLLKEGAGNKNLKDTYIGNADFLFISL